MGGAQSSRAQGGVAVQQPGGGGLEALVSFLGFVSRGEHFVQRQAAHQEGPRGRRGRRDDGMMRLKGHPAARYVLGREAHWRERVGELDRRGYQSLERWWRWRTLVGRWWDWFRSRGVGRRGGLVAATVILAAAAAELPMYEARVLVLWETHLEGGEVCHPT